MCAYRYMCLYVYVNVFMERMLPNGIWETV